ncbi:GAF domain-containing protein [Burkholderia cepacia]|uniref:GAF domain-containing protein n=1 Tax=Burkholderia cepacia TaxID=292 RepID=UPI0017889B5F|nr:GAF domain-containing protein [Burkholderia cepacia]
MAYDSVAESLLELSSMMAKALGAKKCVIVIFGERDITEVGMFAGARFGETPIPRGREGYTNTRHDLHRDPAFNRAATASSAATPPRDKMSSAIVSHEKIIGIVHVYRTPQQCDFDVKDLQLLDTLTFMCNLAIEAMQLRKILASRLTRIALTHSTDNTVEQIVTDFAKNPNRIARILAKSFYREMTRAGFGCNQMIQVASEIISELSNSVRKHHNG